MNRELDTKIVRDVYKWQLSSVGPDCNGENDCEVYTPHGTTAGLDMPPKGTIHPGYFAPCFSSDLHVAITLAKYVKLPISLLETPTNPEKLAQMAYDYYMEQV